ncbi:hypothetical protein [Actinomadura violacea]|uniref:Uncharacterized protein n=1 Tax=Actinomadura violacea TaxID=2819934 RepID=A0ABS3RYA6_9ACTN|nr:hypothetical protein [Actinomadura violacea]MBO2461744.1 hypothetical protein [Actinomadura violacea]
MTTQLANPITIAQLALAGDDGIDVPMLVGGLHWRGNTVHVPARHALLLHGWAAERGISRHADVAVNSVQSNPRRLGAQDTGPTAPLTAEEAARISTEFHASGWGFRIVTAQEVWSVAITQYGDVQTNDLTAVPALTPDDIPSRDDAQVPADMLRTVTHRASALSRAAWDATVARDVAIRDLFAAHPNLSVKLTAEITGLGEDHIEDIKAGRWSR